MNNFIKSVCISLLLAGITANAMDEEQRKQLGIQLIEATRANNIEETRRLLDLGADVNYEDNYGNTPLIWSAASRAVIWGEANGPDQVGQLLLMQLLLNRNANVNHASNDGRTPLVFAVTNGHKLMVQLLLDRGANINHASNNGNTPLIWAALCLVRPGCELFVEWMFQHLIPSEIQKKRWYTFLACLRYNSDDTICRTYTPCILDAFKEQLRANILAENNAKPEDSFACQEINKIEDRENIKQHLLDKYITKNN